MRQKKGVSLLLVAAMILSLSGCNAAVEETVSTEIELIEPVNAVLDTEAVAYRNLYDVKIYSASVYPAVREYSFGKDVDVEKFGVFLGGDVKKGDTLVYGSTEVIDEKIEQMEERIASMEEEIAEAEAALQESLNDSQEQFDWYKTGADAYEKIKPDEYVYASTLETEKDDMDETVSGGDSVGEDNHIVKEDKLVANPAFASWKREADRFIGPYRILAHSRNVMQENFRQRKELYELEHAYYLEQLSDLKAQRKENIVTAKAAGTVMAIPELDYGSYWAAAEKPLIAVGNLEEKYLKCDYINKADVASAKDLYALIDGVRYEIEYQPLDKDAYTKITAGGGKAYATFLLKGNTEQVEVGDFAVIALYKEKKEQVLSVPKEALHKDENGYYVYVVQDGESVVLSVKTGFSDGVYTEIMDGLAENDHVLVEKATVYGEKTAIVEKGSFKSVFEGRGAMYYPITQSVDNTVEYGTTYFGEYLVPEFAYVEKGDAIATVRVVQDEIALQRYKTRLERTQARLEDLRVDGADEREKAIEAKLEEIADLEELIADMEADGATKEIRANTSGIVVRLGEYEKETILPYQSQVALIANAETCYVVVEDENQLLNYGNSVAISYVNQEKQQKQSIGMVANLSAAGVSKELQTNSSYILLPKENISDMLVSNTDGNEWWNIYRYNVTADIRKMDNVLVVPKRAVTEKNGCTYVNILDADGTVTSCSFVAGGYDSANYWVIEGLAEGMVVCLK